MMLPPPSGMRRSDDTVVESLDHLVDSGVGAELDPPPMIGSAAVSDAEWLRQQLDVAQSKLLMAVDSIAGAEAERAVLASRARDLEHQHHMLKVERDELRREVGRLSAELARRRPLRHVLSRAKSLVFGR